MVQHNININFKER